MSIHFFHGMRMVVPYIAVFLAALSVCLPIWIRQTWGTVSFSQIVFFLNTDLTGTDRGVYYSAILFLFVIPAAVCAFFFLCRFLLNRSHGRGHGDGATSSGAPQRSLVESFIDIYLFAGGAFLAGIAILALCLSDRVEVSPFHRNKPGADVLSSDFLIARAGGAVLSASGVPVAGTHSLAAVTSSIKNGYKFLALDLLEIPDGRLVVAPDLESYKYAEKKEFPPVGDLASVRRIMADNPEIFLVVDKVSNWNLLAQELPYGGRMLVVVYSVADYIKAKNAGFAYPVLNIARLDSRELETLFRSNISIVTLPLSRLQKYEDQFRALRRRGLSILVYQSPVINSPKILKKTLGVSADMAFVDYNTDTGELFKMK